MIKRPETSDWFYKLSERDQMSKGDLEEYLSVGEKAIQLCVEALNGKTPKTILDFPSGHGRVLRWMKNQWPEATIYAAEVDADALEFTSSTFGSTPIQDDGHLNMVLPTGLDLIFSGSLLTHFDDWQIEKFLNICIEALSPGGVLVFTAHGRLASLLAKKQHEIYGELIDTAALYKTYLESGFAYLPYAAEYPTYGLTLSSPEWMVSRITQIPTARIGSLKEAGWGHQDVYFVQKHDWPLHEETPKNSVKTDKNDHAKPDSDPDQTPPLRRRSRLVYGNLFGRRSR